MMNFGIAGEVANMTHMTVLIDLSFCVLFQAIILIYSLQHQIQNYKAIIFLYKA
ncbi:hypothetical protein CDL12_24211 [Handroanthus impetiginosus]|uniref:Uncharacterized protein n=1 Tax=Handroanthus impetiginosus TaxID=429701 RepID=A0A2G9GD98_9LAMI|nr:hypothetical protein CDL12_24211 [Handroanthus impetiginosus]